MKDKIGDENAVQTKRMITQILRTGEYTKEQIQDLVILIWNHRIEAKEEVLEQLHVELDDLNETLNTLYNIDEVKQKIQTRKSTKR